MFRGFALAIFLGCLGISAYFRRRARRQGETIPRRREATLLKVGRAVVALPLFAAILIYLANPAWMTWSVMPLRPWVRWIGVAVGVLTLPAALWVFGTLGRNVSETVLTKGDHELVTAGPYRWIRHPLYATGGALFLAIGLISASWLILALALVAVLAIRLAVVPIEERELAGKFGSRYLDYARRTGGMAPRIVKRR